MSRLYARLRRRELEREQMLLVAKALRETGETLPQGRRSAGGDVARLRGIPAIGRGVPGAMPGTRPGSNLR